MIPWFNNVTPFPVAGVKFYRESDSDIVISWTRRSRSFVRLFSESEAPLNEGFEKYSIDILNGGSIIRTIEVTTAQYTYSSADQTIDFGSTQSSIDVNIYQVSSTVGRGRVKGATG